MFMRRIRRRRIKRVNPILIILLFLEFVFPQHLVFAQQAPDVVGIKPVVEVENQSVGSNTPQLPPEIISFPKAQDRKITKVIRVTATAYSSTRAQTDATPFISASGTHVFDGMIAANFLPFGAKVRIPDLYGNKQFVVLDRMHPRFSQRIDIWTESYYKAKQFGVRYVKMEIIE